MTLDLEALVALGRRAGLCAVGVCRAEPFDNTAAILQQRKERGLHGEMQFTYRNPQRSTNAARLLPDAAALIVGAYDFHRDTPEQPHDGRPYGKVAAYARADHYAALREALDTVATALREEGYRAVVTADENHLVDRAAAHRAAIGWWGKSSNILVPGSGSLVVLGAVATDAPICDRDPEPVADGCGACRQCLTGCPTSAIIAPGTVDARRCLAWLVQQDGVFEPDYRVALGARIYGCDDCADVCPPNQVRTRVKLRERQQTGGSRSEPAAWVPILEILEAGDAELLERFGRWYIPKRQPRYLRRNALVVLANIGDGSDPKVKAAVERSLADPDPLIRAHAVWCARRLDLGLESLQHPEDPMVAAELRRPVPRLVAA